MQQTKSLLNLKKYKSKWEKHQLFTRKGHILVKRSDP